MGISSVFGINTVMKKLQDKNRLIVIHGALLVTGFLYYAHRFLMSGIPHYINEDTYFHLNRMIGLRNVFRSPISYLNFAHNGPAVNIFYPWLTMYPMYILYRICGSYVLAYKLFYLLLSILTVYAAFYVMKEISGSLTASFIFSVVYTYSAYRFINVFRRAHLGESISLTALLFVLLGLYNIAFGNRNRWKFLAIGMALIAYSHNLFLATTSAVIGLFLMISVWFWNDRRRRLISFGKAAITAAALSSASIIPILQYLKKDQLYTPGGSGQGLHDTAFPMRMIIEKSLMNQPVSYAPGFLVLAGAVFLILFYSSNFLKKGTVPGNKGIDIFAVLGLIVFFSSSSLLPWKYIGDHTLLYMIQFVWRLNAHSTIFLLAAFSYYVPSLMHSVRVRFIFSAAVLLLSVVLHYSAVLSLHSEENTRIREAEIASGEAITFDYAAKQAKEYRNLHGYAMDDLLVEGVPFSADINYSDDGTIFTVSMDLPVSDKPSLNVDIPVFRYNNQICTLNGIPVTTVISERGGILLGVPSGKNAEISIYSRHTGLTIFSWLFSLSAGILFFCYHSSRKRG